MMIHIVFLSPYEECYKVIDQVFCERPDRDSITYDILLDRFDNKLTVDFRGDAIVSRGFTASTIKKMEIPSAELKISGYDVISAVDRCLRQKQYQKIAIVGAFNMVYGSESIGCVYPEVEICSYTTEREIHLREIVLKAILEGAQAIVGGCSTVEIAKEYHMPTELIESGKEAINTAIDDAIRAVEITNREKQKSSEIANILNYSFQGIISANDKGVITLANNYCFQMLGRSTKELIGERVSKYFPRIALESVIAKGEKILSEIHKINDKMLLVNCVPVRGKNKTVGCVLTFQDVTQIQKEEEKIRKKIYEKGFVAKYSFADILHKDKKMVETIRVAKRFAMSSSNLLIFGETGTGKELFAQSIHKESKRKNEPFVAVNCAALPEDLLESELFGYVEGAFTGASKGGKMGLFEIAHRGTIFLDEIGDISPKLQGRLLRVLQEREIIRLGDDKVIPIDVRVVSATNKNLQNEVEEGRYRQDLLYRLDVLKLTIPSLKERREDILYLLTNYLKRETEKMGEGEKKMTIEAQTLVRGYEWPGNVRELCNFCERICVLSEKEEIGCGDVENTLEFSAEVTKQKGQELGKKTADVLQETEKQLILSALAFNQNNKAETAIYLKMDKSTLWRKMKKYHI